MAFQSLTLRRYFYQKVAGRLQYSPHYAASTGLSGSALDVLRTLDNKGAYQIADTSETQAFWDERVVMGNADKVHITVCGQSFIQTLDKPDQH